ncbi:MAG: hypothetical protein FVQ83_16415 [Chloroflexi bacterium]|nr:hypothetical protein [Chloroflexota bacterium]
MDFSRRDFLKMALFSLGAAFLSACERLVKPTPTGWPTSTVTNIPRAATPTATVPTATINPSLVHTTPLPKGYYLVQGVQTFSTSEYGAISTASEANQISDILVSHPVSGIEYGPIYFHPQDISACISIAEVFKERGIDLWLTSADLANDIHAFNNDTFPTRYRAYSMTPEGSIIPGTVWSLNSTVKVPAFDSMNPEAMRWFISRYKQVYLEPLEPYTSGYFFNEDCLYYSKDPGHPNNSRIDYWELAAYSDAVLELWQQYCAEHSVTFNGNVVSKFPVHTEAMVLNGGGKTEYYPGYNVPSNVSSGTPIVSLPRNTGVWEAWDDFVTSQYVNSWIGEISKAVYEVNSRNRYFKGVIYFGLHNWSLGYEEVTDPTFTVDSMHQWVPWGTQRGVRLSKICALPFVDYIICETYPPIQANLYHFASSYKQIVEDSNKTFGLMLHRDDDWGLDGKDMEGDRWEMIQSLQPTIIARYPILRLFPNDPFYNDQNETLFDTRVLAYRQ